MLIRRLPPLQQMKTVSAAARSNARRKTNSHSPPPAAKRTGRDATALPTRSRGSPVAERNPTYDDVQRAAGRFRLWHLFVVEAYDVGNALCQNAVIFLDFFKENFCFDAAVLHGIRTKNTIFVAARELALAVQPKCDLVAALAERPALVLQSLQLAACEALLHFEEAAMEGLWARAGDCAADFGSFLRARVVRRVEVRLVGSGLEAFNVTYDEFKCRNYDRFVCVKGAVARVSNVKPLPTQLCFSCVDCGTLQVLDVVDGMGDRPGACVVASCRSLFFQPLFGSPFTRIVESQSIRLQEIATDSRQFSRAADDDLMLIVPEEKEGDAAIRQNRASQVPKSIDVVLAGDAVGAAKPGDVVCASGIVKGTPNGGGDRKRGPQSAAIFTTYIDAHTLAHCKTASENLTPGPSDDAALLLTASQTAEIERFCAAEDSFALLVDALCPAIYGHEAVKAGLLLALFSGARSVETAGDEGQRFFGGRQASHVLVIGDPGLGKSQMLCAAAAAAPRSVTVCGMATSNAGLTVALTHDAATGDYALDAGALVLADCGVCCIDEFDKMESHRALLEAMEQQSISVAKAGIVCTLPCRTTVIAAANPTAGHFVSSKSFLENVGIDVAVLSRFDMLFVLRDRPNEHLDRFLSHHILHTHANTATPAFARDAHVTSGNLIGASALDAIVEVCRGSRSTVSRSRRISIDFLRRVIFYARAAVHPTLSPEAKAALREFYVSLRRRTDAVPNLPVTARTLESLVRMTRAKARASLRTVASKQDADFAIEMLAYCHENIATAASNNNVVQAPRNKGSAPSSKTHSVKTFVAALQANDRSRQYTVADFEEIVRTHRLHVEHIVHFIDELHAAGAIIRTATGTYRRA